MSSFNKIFEKQIKSIENQRKNKQKQLKTGMWIKMINQKPQRYLIILLEKEKKVLNKFYEDIDMKKFYFKYEGSTKDVNSNEYYNSKQLFNGIKDQKIIFNDALCSQKELFQIILNFF